MYLIGGPKSLAETRAYFPSREEAERFARQFDGTRYRIDILPQPRQDRQVFQVHVQQVEVVHDRGAFELLRIVGAMGERATGAGLDGPMLSRRMGRALGEAVAAKHASPGLERREALSQLGALLQVCGLGGLSVVSSAPLVLRVQAPVGSAPGSHGCAHVAGFLEGSLGYLLGKAPIVREIDCVGRGSDDCGFVCEL